MRMLLFCLLIHFPVFAMSAEQPVPPRPYITITVNGLEEIAPPLNRMAESLEQLVQSDKVSEADQRRLSQMIGELQGVTGRIDTMAAQVGGQMGRLQQAVSAQVKQWLLWSFIGLLLLIASIGLVLWLLLKWQLAPLVHVSTQSAKLMTHSLQDISSTARLIAGQADQQRTRPRPFARRPQC